MTTIEEPTPRHLEERCESLEAALSEARARIDDLERERRFTQKLADMARILILVLDEEGHIIWFNRFVSKISGYSLPDVRAKDWFSLCVPESDRESARARFKQAMAADPEGPALSPLMTRDGAVCHVEWNDTVIQGSVRRHLLSIGQDVTEKHHIEPALVWQSQANAALAELSTALIRPGSVDEIAFLVLNHACRLTQSPFGFVGHVDVEGGELVCPAILAPDMPAAPPRKPLVTLRLDRGLKGWVFTHRCSLLTNTAGVDPRIGPLPAWHPPIERFLSVPALVEGQLVGQIGLANSLRDYSEKDLLFVERLASLYALALHHRRIHNTMVASEERFRTVFKESPVGIELFDSEGCLVDTNPACLEMFGEKDRTYFSGLRLFTGRVLSQKEINDLKNGQTVRCEAAFDAGGIRRAGSSEHLTSTGLFLDITLCRIGGQGPGAFQGYLGLLQDVTVQKKTELALRQSEEKLRHLSSALLRAQEEERRRISYGLHDELGQSLAVLKLQIGSALSQAHKAHDVLPRECEAVLVQLDDIIESTRRLSRGLSPAVLENLGLTAAIRWLVNEFAGHHPFAVDLDLPSIDHLFDPQSEIIIYRIIQESLMNIVKHAGASRVSVSVRRRPERVRFSVTDNGAGFDMAEVNQRRWPQKGLGLTAMEERARILGGPLRRVSRKSRGTRISFTVPIKLKQARP